MDSRKRYNHRAILFCTQDTIEGVSGLGSLAELLRGEVLLVTRRTSTAPSRLGDCWRHWQEKEIVLSHLRLIVGGSCAFLGGVPKATLIHYACH
jgi:hypothetical protein